jgi:hypothetical protein
LGVSFILRLFIITIGGIMGKKKRILRRGKFEALRKHRKFSGLVGANLTQEELEETIQFVTPEKTEEPAKTEEPVKTEITPPTVSLVESPAPRLEPNPIPEIKKVTAKTSAKKASSTKKPKARRSARKKTVTQSTR